MEKPAAAYYHLPGLFEFYELYRRFLPLYREHREYFYDWCAIGSIYGAPAGCIWGGGRISSGGAAAREVLALLREYGISGRLTFSNSLLRAQHLADPQCNALCEQFAKSGGVPNGVIIHSDLLADYLQQRWPELYLVSSHHKSAHRFCAVAAGTGKAAVPVCGAGFPAEPGTGTAAHPAAGAKGQGRVFVQRVLLVRLHRAQALLRDGQPSESGRGLPGPPLRRPGRRRGLPLFQGDAQPRIYRGGGHPTAVLPAFFQRVVLEFLLYYMTKPEYQLQVRGNLSGQYAGPFLRKLHRADYFLSGAVFYRRDLYRKTFFSPKACYNKQEIIFESCF